jgi:starch synthase
LWSQLAIDLLTFFFSRDKILYASHGLDGELWNPSKDIYLAWQYSTNDIVGKSFCREALKRHLGLSGDLSL